MIDKNFYTLDELRNMSREEFMDMLWYRYENPEWDQEQFPFTQAEEEQLGENFYYKIDRTVTLQLESGHHDTLADWLYLVGMLDYDYWAGDENRVDAFKQRYTEEDINAARERIKPSIEIRRMQQRNKYPNRKWE